MQTTVDDDDMVVAAFAPPDNLELATEQLMSGREFRHKLRGGRTSLFH
jgi:hypothetical protein